MKRLIAALLAFVAAWLGCAPTAAAAVPSATSGVYTYDAPAHNALGVGVVSERGPPTGDSRCTTHDPVDRSSHGASVRTRCATTPSYNTYDPTAQLVQVERGRRAIRTPTGAGDADLCPPAGVSVAAKSATGAESALSGALLRNHLRQLEKYGQGGFRELESGRFRYYGNLTPAAKQGEKAGRRLVREWNPGAGATRTWHETLDRSGNVRIVRPETGGPKTHYSFDEFGNFGGAW